MKDVESRLSGTRLAEPSDDLDQQVERLLQLAQLAELGRTRYPLGRWAVPMALAAGVLIGTVLPRQGLETPEHSTPSHIVEVAPSPALERILTGGAIKKSRDPFSRIVTRLEVTYVAGSWTTDRQLTGGQL